MSITLEQKSKIHKKIHNHHHLFTNLNIKAKLILTSKMVSMGRSYQTQSRFYGSIPYRSHLNDNISDNISLCVTEPVNEVICYQKATICDTENLTTIMLTEEI